MAEMSPASLPWANLKLRVEAVPVELVEIIRRNQPRFWPTEGSQLDSILRTLQPLNLTWDLSGVGGDSTAQSVPLAPGRRYHLGAEVKIAPVYEDDLVGTRRIVSFAADVVRTSASVLADPNLRSNACKLRYSTPPPLTKVRISRLD
jgi:hypothetical protein